MPVRLNSTGGGSVTLDVPATGTTTTLNLPITGGSLAAGGAIGSSGLTMNSDRLLGRTTAGSGAVEEISVGSGLTLSAGTLAAAATGADRQVFDTSGSNQWNKPTGFPANSPVLIEAWGAGGSGGRGTAGGGGGGGAYASRWTVLSALGSSETVTVGAGGAARSGSNQTGQTGGNSSFGSHITAYGGAGGSFYVLPNTSTGGGGGGQLSAGSGNQAGRPRIMSWAEMVGDPAALSIINQGDSMFQPSSYNNRNDAIFHGGAGNTAGQGAVASSSVWGGGGGGGGGGGSNNTAGTSQFGGNGGAGGTTGTAGVQPGGGGGGGTSTSGAGGNGRVIVTVFRGA